MVFTLKGKTELKRWLSFVIESSHKIVGDVNIILTNDVRILEINKKYLNHDYFTDIITFNYNEEGKVSGDIFISLDTVKSNALSYQVLFDHELRRVMVHGVLHLLGFDDKSNSQQEIMRAEEDKWLSVLESKSYLK